MFGKNKKRHDQAVILLRDTFDLISEIVNMDSFDDVEDYNVMANINLTTVGFCTYYIAALNKPLVANIFLDTYANLYVKENELNTLNLSLKEAKKLIDSRYNEANRIANELRKQNYEFDDVLKSHAKKWFDIVNVTASEKDENNLYVLLKMFYENTYQRYYG